MNEEIINFENLNICREDNVDSDNKEVYYHKLDMKILTWMKLYANLETCEYRAKMRDVSISIAETLCKSKNFIKEHGTFNSKFTLSIPYHFFLSVVSELEDTYNQNFTVTFHEILDYTVGEIVDSLHLSHKVELSWIINEYMLAAQNPKMTIICSQCFDEKLKNEIPFDINISKISFKSDYENHHSKISILKYSNNKIRIIIFTANLRNIDWKFYSQGLWISPLLSSLPDDADPSEGESNTNFKKDFTEYLHAYKNTEIFGWEALVQKADCSSINIFFIGSIPGSHYRLSFDKWGQRKLANVLTNHVTIESNSQNWPIVAQCSSIGSYGNSYEDWLLTNAVLPMSREKNKKIIFLPDFKLIYPTKDYFNKSIAPSSVQEYLYHSDIHKAQLWITDYFYQWKSKKRCQTFCIPNIKTYARFSPDDTEISWFFLTSSNLCKNGFGNMDNKFNKDSKFLKICNYEAGVLFIPEFIIKQTTFPIKESQSPEIPIFLLPYDVPLIPYEPDDEPVLRTVYKNKQEK